MIFILRFISDIFWNIKAINIASNGVLVFLILQLAIKNKIALKGYSLKPVTYVVLLGISFLVSFFKDVSVDTAILLFKVLLSLIMFFYGVIYTENIFKTIRLLSKVSIVLLVFNFLLSFTPFAYQYWGSVRTFSGLYFFKTDMALAVVIFLSLVLVDKDTKTNLKVLSSLISLYLVYLTNARIHYLSVFLVIGVALYGTGFFAKVKSKLTYFIPISAVGFVIFILVLNTIGDENSLKIDIFSSNAYNDSNLQGRNQIWNTLIEGFQKAGFGKQLFGMGLEADIQMTAGNLQDSSAHNAHNGYLFVLIATGFVGLFLFLHLIYQFAVRFFFLAKIYNRLPRNSVERMNLHSILYLFFSHSAIFLVASLTASSILFQQQTWFFMFFAGYLFNPKLLAYLKQAFAQLKTEEERSSAKISNLTT